MLSTYAYYASSPFNLLLIFFKTDLALGVNFISILKFFLSSLFFCILLNKLYCYHHFAKGLFSSCYAFIGYMTFFLWNASWMDGVVMLPLLTLGMRKMLIERKCLLYIVILSFSLLSNFYIGYMLCITTIIFYFFFLIEKQKHFVSRLKSTLWLYTASSVLAGSLSAFLLIPVYYGLPTNRYISIIEVFKNMSFNFKALDILQMFYTGAIKLNDQSHNMPIIFFGIVGFILVISFFINHKISARKKIIYSLLCLIFLLSFQLSTINIIWHGFSNNVWFNYRYSFILSFVFLLIAFEGYINFSCTNSDIYKTGTVFILLSALTFYADRPNFSAYSVIGDIVIALISLFLIKIIHTSKNFQCSFAKITLVILVLGNIWWNSWNSTYEGVSHTSVSNYQNAKETYDNLTKFIEDKDFFRIGKVNQYSRCDASQFNYAGISDYASTENIKNLNLVKKLGISQSWMWAGYNIHTPESVDDYLSIRYVMSDINLNNKTYKSVSQSDNTQLYKNKHALPLIFKASSQIPDLKDLTNNFDIINSYWNSLSVSNYGEVFEKITPDIISKQNNNELIIHFSLSSKNAGKLYMQLPNAKIRIEIPNLNNLPAYTTDQEIYYIGEIKKGEQKEIILHVHDSIDIHKIFFAIERKEILDNYLNESLEDKIYIEEKSSSKLLFKSNNNDKQFYSSSIPYDKFWKVVVDDRTIETFDNGHFLSFMLPSGSHTVHVTYEPKGSYLGILITLISLFILFILFIPSKIKKYCFK